jgi:serine/threonine protein kinase
LIKLFPQAMNALCYFESQGLVHCDLKTDNIFIASNGILKIGDFGLAVLLEDVRKIAFYSY